MPDRDAEAHQNARLLTVLIWAGVGLAPVAALVVLLGGSESSVRFAVLLIAVCVVLIGAALLIRNDPVLLRMDVEARVEELREELREEITASAHATGHRVKALQDEMTRMRAAGSPAMALPPASARATAPAGGRAAVAVAAVAPAGGHTAVARIPAAVAPVTGSASVGSASVRPSAATAFPATGSAATGSAAVAVAAVPLPEPALTDREPARRPRGAAAVSPTSGHGYESGREADDPDAPRPFDGYGPGSSGSDWAERGGAAEYPADEAARQAERKPSRRHAAPDTGTDLARYGLGSPAAPAQTYGGASVSEAYGGASVSEAYGGASVSEAYGGASVSEAYGGASPGTYGSGYDLHQTGDHDRAEPASGAFGVETSSFFAGTDDATDDGEYSDDRHSDGRFTDGRFTDDAGYGADPMGIRRGWAHRSHERPSRW
jgi:hypothetical protein